MKRITATFTILLLIWILPQSSCQKEAYPDIPNVYVNMYLDISSTLYVELATVGGYVYLTGGYRGILVYRASTEQFMAYERCCPYDADQNSAVITVDPSGLTMTDSTCMSTYLILDGSVVSGPATLPLKQYNTSFNGDDLHIFN